MLTFRHVAPLAALAILLPAAAPDEPLVACDGENVIEEGGDAGAYDAVSTGTPDPSDGTVGGWETDIVTIVPSVGESAIKATVTAVMTYEVPGDLELFAYDADGGQLGSSTAFNPGDQDPGAYSETVTVSVAPCEEVSFTVANYLSAPGTPVHLEVTVEGKRPRVRG